MSSTNTGAALGGAAGARDRRKTRELEEQRQGLIERQFEVNRQTELLQKTRDQIAKLTEQATGLVSNIPAGRDDPRFQAAIAPIREALATLAARGQQNFPGSIDAQTQLALFDSQITGTPTQLEATRAAAEAGVARAQAIGQGLAGADENTRIAAGLATPPRSATAQDQALEVARAGRSAAAPKPIVVNPGDTVLGPDGKTVLFEAPGGTGGRPLVVNPGDSLVTPEGDVLLEVPEEPPADPETVRLQAERDSAEQRGDMRRAQELTDIIARRGTVTGTTEFDPSGPGFAEAMVTPTEDDVERLRTNIRTNQSMASTTQNTLAAVEEAGGFSTGFVGASTETITGILSQLGAVGDAINAGIENVTGADLEKLTTARTRMREGVASALPEITEEDSGRFTNEERRLANETLRGLTPSADIDQVIAAYRTFFQIINASDIRNAGEIATSGGLDLATPDGVNQLADILKSNGMADDRILEVLNQVVPQ